MLREVGQPEIIQALLLGARWTVLLALIALAGGAPIALGVAFARISAWRLLRLLASGYIQLLQGTPLLMQFFLSFFGLGILGFDVSPWSAAAIALIAHTSAFLGEIWRGCLQAVPHGQWEAGAVLGLSYPQRLVLVIVPQAVRLAIPSSVGFLVQVIKGTSLASVIGFIELMETGKSHNSIAFRPFEFYGLVALIYFALCYPLTVSSRWLERRLEAAG
jgi:polar amino acid transport system permease protein